MIFKYLGEEKNKKHKTTTTKRKEQKSYD